MRLFQCNLKSMEQPNGQEKKSPNSLQKKSEGEKKTIKKDFSYLFHLLINPK